MSTAGAWFMLMAVIAGFLLLDLRIAWNCYRDSICFEPGLSLFFRFWVAMSRVKLLAVTVVIVTVTSALLLPDYTLEIPRLATLGELPKAFLGALALGFALIFFVSFDLLMSRRAYRRGQEWNADEVGFIRWWLAKSSKMLGVMAGVASLLLATGWVAQHYQLHRILVPKNESAALIDKARSYYQAGHYREATLELRTAIQRNRDDHEAYLWLARSWWRLNELPQARDAYRETLRINPRQYPALLELGRLTLAMNDRKAALTPAEQALALEPKSAEPRMLLAQIRFAAGDLPGALREYRTVLQADPTHREACKEVVTLLLAGRAFTDAIRECEAWLSRNPGDTEFRLQLALAQESAGLLPAALATLLAAAEQDQAAALPLTIRGDMYHRNREYLRALACYEEALLRSPGEKVVMNNIALLHAEHGYDLERAALLASQLYSSAPGDPTVLDTYGWVLCKQGKLGQALPLLRRSVAGLPQAPEGRYHLGAALLKAGRIAAGRMQLEKALELSKDFDGAVQARKLLACRS